MSKNSPAIEGQLQIPSTIDVVQFGIYPDISDEGRITLRRLIALAGHDTIVEPEPEIDDLQNAQPKTIRSGLYIPHTDDRYDTAQQLVKVGVRRDMNPTDHNVGIVFPSSEYATVARSPKDLASHVEARTRNANKDNSDRDEVDRKVGRSVGHALSGKITSIVNLNGDLTSEIAMLSSLNRDLNQSWTAHYKVKNLEKKRVRVDEIIHDVAETATINLNLDTPAVQGLHRAIKKNLYGGNRTHAQIAHNWQAYIKFVGRYMGAKVHKLEISEAMARKEFSRYRLFLEPEARPT